MKKEKKLEWMEVHRYQVSTAELLFVTEGIGNLSSEYVIDFFSKDQRIDDYLRKVNNYKTRVRKEEVDRITTFILEKLLPESYETLFLIKRDNNSNT